MSPSTVCKSEELRYELSKLIRRYGRKQVTEMLFTIIINPYPELKHKKIKEIGRWQT